MNYLDDDAVTLERGAIDHAGAQKYGKIATVPDNYVTDLQKDLQTLGFSPGEADGIFGAQTRDALISFQYAANSPIRLVNDQTEIQVVSTYTAVAHGSCDAATRQELRLWLNNHYQLASSDSPSRWIGPENPQMVSGIQFADSSASAQYWPIHTHESGGREIAYLGVSGTIYGQNGRRFLASRDSGTRFHVGIDLWGKAGDIVVACEAGTIVNHYHFYNGVYALFVECDSGIVINYGEVAEDSWKKFGLNKGSRVAAGQKIACIGQMHNSAMCHFETYKKGTIDNKKYLTNDATPPIELLNPTKYLLHLAKNGI